MGKWLAKFSGDSSESLPDITDTLPSVSGLSGPHLESLPEIACPGDINRLTRVTHSSWLADHLSRPDERLQGRDLDRDHGTVVASTYGAHGWTFTLTDGKTIPMQAVRGVAKTASYGQIVAAWTVRAHGLDGEGR